MSICYSDKKRSPCFQIELVSIKIHSAMVIKSYTPWRRNVLDIVVMHWASELIHFFRIYLCKNTISSLRKPNLTLNLNWIKIFIRTSVDYCLSLKHIWIVTSSSKKIRFAFAFNSIQNKTLENELKSSCVTHMDCMLLD